MVEREAPLDTCGCCEGADELTPAPVENRPGLPELRYRVGSHGTFKETMKAKLSGDRALRALTTRRDDDASIALIDAWSTVLDVLTFYDERIANEGYLRTAVEARSVTELARSIGYQPSPGAAASTHLAFELEAAPGGPPNVAIPVGARVQSLPGPGQTPQTFETVEAIEARPGWNALRPEQAVPRTLGIGDTSVYLAGTDTGLKPGDALVVVGPEREQSPASPAWQFRLAKTVDAQPDHGRTRVTWEQPLTRAFSAEARLFALRQRASLFGYNAPDWRAMPQSVRQNYEFPVPVNPIGGINLFIGPLLPSTDWPGLRLSLVGTNRSAPNPAGTVYLDSVYPKIVPKSWVVLATPDHVRLFRPSPALGDAAVAESSRTDFTMSAKTTRLRLEGPNITDFENALRETVVYAQSEEAGLAEVPIIDPIQGSAVTVTPEVQGLEKGRNLAVTGRRPRVQVAEGAHLTLTSGAGSVTLSPLEQLDVMGPFGQIGASRTWSLRTADGTVGTVTAPTSALVPVPAPPAAEVLGEVAVLRDLAITTVGARTVLHLDKPLVHAYDRTSCVVAANVALATHGESKHEVLGHGDGSQPFQSFTLKQAPLTYVPSSAPTGSTTTLVVRVGEVQWDEAHGLLGLGPRDRAYIVRIADDGKVAVSFGDGRNGARLPTGRENLSADYRVGIGRAGNVKAGQLSLLLTRPLGLKSVRNPLDAIPGADPESRDEARDNAPRTVVTFDRVVSLTDFEDFARAFAGVAKAQATWAWDGEARLAFITVAGVDGTALPDGSVTHVDLTSAIARAGDPYRLFRVRSYEPVTFEVVAGVFLKPGYEWDRVRAAAETAIREAFGFGSRSLAQSVTNSEVVAVIQNTEGVMAVDLDALHVTGQPPPPHPVLVAQPARPARDGIAPAQLLSISPAVEGVELVRRT